MGLEKEELLGRVLEAIENAPPDSPDVPDVLGLNREETLSAVEELVERRWVQASYVNTGDGGLRSIWEPRLTNQGRAALARLLSTFAISPDKVEKTLEEKRVMRAQFMQALYETTGGSPSAPANVYTIAGKLKWTNVEADQIAEYLAGEKLLEPVAFGGQIAITHPGVREVEQSMGAPEKPTEHFPPANSIYINYMSNSQIQQGTSGSQQIQVLSAEQRANIAESVDIARGMLGQLEMSEGDRGELEAELDTVTRQLQSPRPKVRTIREGLKRAAEILGTATVVAGSSVQLATLIEKLHALVPGI